VPFTPYHFGLGITCKSLAPRHLAALPFLAAQGAVDVAPGVRMIVSLWEHHLKPAGGGVLACRDAFARWTGPGMRSSENESPRRTPPDVWSRPTSHTPPIPHHSERR
jgi:hypothetical protein